MGEAKRRRLAAWLRGEGIEVGALNNPLWVHPHAHVRYVDRLPIDEQRRQYPELADRPLAPVDVLGNAQDLSGFGDASLDFVIANHLLEHLEDPIAGLLEFQRVLKPGGVVYLALPDQRLTFDRNRELTSVEHLVRDHDDGGTTSRRDHYLDWAHNVVGVRPEDLESWLEAMMAQQYSIHFHCWQPDTFLEFFVVVREKAGLDFEVVAFAPPEDPDDDEFILVLVKERSDGVRFPPPVPPVGLRARLARSPLGPPLLALKRASGRLGGRRPSPREKLRRERDGSSSSTCFDLERAGTS
jgi:SAM-dependent methyltransferase